MVAKISINLALTEILICWGHSAMHTSPYLMKYHIFHHCCVHSTFNTNLLFHPVDLAIEFAGPAAALLGMHFVVWNKDQAVLLVTYIVFQLWYAYDHDEHLGLPHIKHHSACDSLYLIYTTVRRGNPKRNELRERMQREGLLLVARQ